MKRTRKEDVLEDVEDLLLHIQQLVNKRFFESRSKRNSNSFIDSRTILLWLSSRSAGNNGG